MMKKFTCLGCATLGLFGLSACGSSTPISFDNSSIWSGGPNATNQVTTQGYWWTYTDHAAYDINHGAATYEQGANINPHTDLTTPLVLEDDPQRGKIIHAWGSVPPAPDWSTLINTALYPDLYWQSVYPNSLLQDYPLAGVGFGYQANNAPYDVVQGKYVGIVFDMKTEGGTNDIAVAVPTAVTDLPDPNNNDKWTKQCTYPSQQPGLTGAASYQKTTGSQTCFADYQKIFYMLAPDGTFPGDIRAADGNWQTYCVLWSELGLPSWVNSANLPAGVSAVILAQTLKTKWDFYQPSSISIPPGSTPADIAALIAAASARFDIHLDNFKMVTAEDALANGICNPTNVPSAATIANVPAQ